MRNAWAAAVEMQHIMPEPKLYDASSVLLLMDVSIYINININIYTLFSHDYVLIDVFK